MLEPHMGCMGHSWAAHLVGLGQLTEHEQSFSGSQGKDQVLVHSRSFALGDAGEGEREP